MHGDLEADEGMSIVVGACIAGSHICVEGGQSFESTSP